MFIRRFSTPSSSSSIKLHPRVRDALSRSKPVVALESTIISHGMPFPHNLNCARDLEGILLDHGVTPATVGIVGGRPVVGMDDDELQMFADPSVSVMKASRRDLASIFSRGAHGATTVSATMILAHSVGIPLFVTGGIGGVHRQGEHTLDISADLTELGRTPVGVVSAGVKSILDVGRTLEYLETQGVPVATISESHHAEFPSFYTRHSGFRSPLVVNDPHQAAQLMYSQFNGPVKLSNGIVFGCPVPMQFELDPKQINRVIEESVRDAESLGIHGKEVTPFLLKRIADATEMKSLDTNIQLIRNNATVGALIAVEYQKLMNGSPRNSTIGLSDLQVKKEEGPLFVGVAALDFISSVKRGHGDILGTSSPATIAQSYGGVARNIVEAFSRTFRNPLLQATFVYPQGQDEAAKGIEKNVGELRGVVPVPLTFENASSPVYNAVLDQNGGLVCAAASMDIAGDSLVNSRLQSEIARRLPYTSLLVSDANVAAETIVKYGQLAHGASIPFIFEPTSVPKCVSVLNEVASSDSWDRIGVTCATPNEKELEAMAKLIPAGKSQDAEWHMEMVDSRCERRTISPEASSVPNVSGILSNLNLLSSVIPIVAVKLGPHGVLFAHRRQSHLYIAHYPPTKDEGMPVVNETGAGDTFVGAFVAGVCELVYQRESNDRNNKLERFLSICDDNVEIDRIVRRAITAAEMTLDHVKSVSPHLDAL